MMPEPIMNDVRGSTPPTDRGIAASRQFIERHGATLLQVMLLAAGKAGGDTALRLIGSFRDPGEPKREDVLDAVRDLRSILEEVPVNVEPQVQVAEVNDIAGLDAAVNWHLGRMCDLEARLS